MSDSIEERTSPFLVGQAERLAAQAKVLGLDIADALRIMEELREIARKRGEMLEEIEKLVRTQGDSEHRLMLIGMVLKR